MVELKQEKYDLSIFGCLETSYSKALFNINLIIPNRLEMVWKFSAIHNEWLHVFDARKDITYRIHF